MFRHKGNRRTYKHNLRLASMLSFIAGIVNICGVLSFNILTTNVTGHFAYFSEEFFKNNYLNAASFLLYTLFFLLGAFVSNVFIEITSRIRPDISHTIPMIFEALILSYIGYFAPATSGHVFIVCALLFAMGMQNSLVTQISEYKVRTTHLTGLFTDLGIELSQLFFYRKQNETKQLSRSIYLRLIIIGCFFIGCFMGGLLFSQFKLGTLLFASGFLIIAMYYDVIRYNFLFYKRKIISR